MKKYIIVSAAILLLTETNGVHAAGDFNPDISLILDGRYVRYNNDNAYELPGFMLSDEADRAREGFQLGHNELAISASVDDMFNANMAAAITDRNGETDVDLEEAYMEATGMGGGTVIKAGRFYSGIGYLNSRHAHDWDFVDSPLIYRGLFGEQLRDDGVQLGLTVPGTYYLNAGMEFTRGARFPASGDNNHGARAQAAFLKFGNNVGVRSSWQLGLSHWRAEVEERASGDRELNLSRYTPSFTGDSSISGVDLIWNWANGSGPDERILTIQAEYFIRDEDGEIEMLQDEAVIDRFTYDGQQTGWYAQAVYQFIPRWRAGLRYDQLGTNNEGSDTSLLVEAGLDDSGQHPRRTSLMVDYSHSEYSRLRLQYAYDESYGDNDDVLLFQYIMSLGSHGAHRF